MIPVVVLDGRRTVMAAVRYMVDDLRAATAFYIEQLGFTEKENWGPIVILERGDLELWLSGPGHVGGEACASSATASSCASTISTKRSPIWEAPPRSSTAVQVAGQSSEDPTGNLVELYES